MFMYLYRSSRARGRALSAHERKKLSKLYINPLIRAMSIVVRRCVYLPLDFRPRALTGPEGKKALNGRRALSIICRSQHQSRPLDEAYASC